MDWNVGCATLIVAGALLLLVVMHYHGRYKKGGDNDRSRGYTPVPNPDVGPAPFPEPSDYVTIPQDVAFVAVDGVVDDNSQDYYTVGFGMGPGLYGSGRHTSEV